MAEKNLYFKRPELLNIELTCAQVYQEYDDKIAIQICNQFLITYLIDLGYTFTYDPNPILFAMDLEALETIKTDIEEFYAAL
jgi:hypothetical protein